MPCTLSNGRHTIGGMDAFHLAQLNVAKAIAPLDSETLAPFMDAIDGVNAIADTSPGFVWRLEDEDDDEHPGATGIQAYDDPWLIVNLSVWESREALWDFVYGGGHLEIMRRRREWFTMLGESHLVMWWVPAGEIPTRRAVGRAPRPPARARAEPVRVHLQAGVRARRTHAGAARARDRGWMTARHEPGLAGRPSRLHDVASGAARSASTQGMYQRSMYCSRKPLTSVRSGTDAASP